MSKRRRRHGIADTDSDTPLTKNRRGGRRGRTRVPLPTIGEDGTISETSEDELRICTFCKV
jgi:hypothetical protein